MALAEALADALSEIPVESLAEILMRFGTLIMRLKIAAAPSRSERRSGRSIVDVVESSWTLVGLVNGRNRAVDGFRMRDG